MGVVLSVSGSSTPSRRTGLRRLERSAVRLDRSPGMWSYSDPQKYSFRIDGFPSRRPRDINRRSGGVSPAFIGSLWPGQGGPVDEAHQDAPPQGSVPRPCRPARLGSVDPPTATGRAGLDGENGTCAQRRSAGSWSYDPDKPTVRDLSDGQFVTKQSVRWSSTSPTACMLA